MNDRDTSMDGGFRGFPSTILECVDAIRQGGSDARRTGWESLARGYWKPVYCHLRISTKRSNEDAKDLTQAFFLWMQEEDLLARYVPERGSFRGFLKGVLRNFLGNAVQAEGRIKRGGDVKLLSLDMDADGISIDPTHDPDKAFDRAWMDALVRDAVERVRAREAGAVRFRVFEACDLAAAGERPSYGDLAAKFKIKETDVRNHLSTIRHAVRDEVRNELLRNSPDTAQFQEEWNAFLQS